MSPRGQGANTPTRPIRVDLDLWEAFGEAIKQVGFKDRSAYLREVMRWVIHDEGSPRPSAPKRPREATPRSRREEDPQ
jgi:hypothetical protein